VQCSSRMNLCRVRHSKILKMSGLGQGEDQGKGKSLSKEKLQLPRGLLASPSFSSSFAPAMGSRKVASLFFSSPGHEKRRGIRSLGQSLNSLVEVFEPSFPTLLFCTVGVVATRSSA